MFPFGPPKPCPLHVLILIYVLLIYYVTQNVPSCCAHLNLAYNFNGRNDNTHYRTVQNHQNVQLVGESLVSATTTTTTPQASIVTVPDFEEPIGNHTVALGRNAELACKINNLSNFRTAWLRVEDKGILTIHNNIITRNYRIGLINNEDGKNFVLTIKNVQPSDKGGYMCQINSVPMKYAIGYLDVLTPPVFEDSPPPTALIGDDSAIVTITPPSQQAPASLVTVNEGSNATLSCRATGNPTPDITWRREDNEPILLNGAQTSEGLPKVEGSSIHLTSVSRRNSGAYLCIASNGVQPSASKRQTLDVQFSPVIRLPQTELGAQLQQAEARLTCFVELSPLGSYHWVKLGAKKNQEQPHSTVEDDDLSLLEHDELTNSDKFEIVMKQVNNERILMILNIRRIERPDFGWYKCIARNSLGIQSSSIRLYESSSSSFNMFRGGGSGPNQMDNPSWTEPDRLQQQNDQQQEGGLNRGQTSAKQGSILSRAQTRSSWIHRSGLTGRSQDSTGGPPNQPHADTSSTDPSSGSTLSALPLLSSHYIPLLLTNCILLIVTAAQVVVFTIQE